MKKFVYLFFAMAALTVSLIATGCEEESWPANVYQVSIDPASFTVGIGESKQLDAVILPENAANKKVTWYSDDPEVADVSSSGVVTGVYPGTTTINVITHDGEYEAACYVIVIGEPGPNDVLSKIPDPDFLAYCYGYMFAWDDDPNPILWDTDGDGALSFDEAAAVEQIGVNSWGIASLEGIEYFTGLTSLYISNNRLTSLDLSKNTALTELHCGGNQLTSLDLSNNTALTYLDCMDNQLTSLDLSKNTKLLQLHCNQNQLTSLDLSKNTALQFLECNANQLTSLDLSNCTALTNLTCEDNQLTSLDLSKNTALNSLRCDRNRLTSLDVSTSTALFELYCNSNSLTSLDASDCPLLGWLYCNQNQLTSIDVSNCPALGWLHCNQNRLTSLDVSDCPALHDLYCEDNLLTSIDISNNKEMTSFYCSGNPGDGESQFPVKAWFEGDPPRSNDSHFENGYWRNYLGKTITPYYYVSDNIAEAAR